MDVIDDAESEISESSSDLLVTRTFANSSAENQKSPEENRENALKNRSAFGSFFVKLMKLEIGDEGKSESKSKGSSGIWFNKSFVLNAHNALFIFFAIGFLFLAIGVGLKVYVSNEVFEHRIDYTTCEKVNGSGITCDKEIRKNLPWQYEDPCKCELNFQLPQDVSGEVFMYYGLTNFYQNHRVYAKSRSDKQLLGMTDLDEGDYKNCKKLAKVDGKWIFPCGLIANSLFNDSFTLVHETKGEVGVDRTGIAWPSDKKLKFKNPVGNLSEALKNFSNPPSWGRKLWELDLENPDNNGLQNEDFIVWMRTAALPNFRKLYRRVNYHKSPNFDGKLPKGNYSLLIDYRYPVTQFDGTKSFIIATKSIIGTKNQFLGNAFITFGSICIILGSALLFIHQKTCKKEIDLDET